MPIVRISSLILLVLVTATACGGSSTPAAAPASFEEADDRPALQSNDIMDRERLADKTEVRHILISWKDLAGTMGRGMDERAKTRSAAAAETLVTELTKRARAGEDFVALMKAHSEDQGSAKSGDSYTVTLNAKLVFEFKRMGLRLKVGEVGIVRSQFGWHIIKRVE